MKSKCLLVTLAAIALQVGVALATHNSPLNKATTPAPRTLRRLTRLRGGSAPLLDHRAAVSALFNNMRTPAALIGGAIVPLGINNPPTIDWKKDGAKTRLIKRFYQLVGVFSMYNELLAIVYATIACNKLAEVNHGPTASVDALISRECELAWIGTNLHFLAGLAGFGTMVGIKRYLCIEKTPTVSIVSGLWTAAALCNGMAIVNRGIAQGDGDGGNFGKNIVHLMVRYIQLLYRDAQGPLSYIALGLVVASGVVIGRDLVKAKRSFDATKDSWQDPPHLETSMSQFDVTVPEGVEAGQALQVQAPGGQALQVNVPEGLKPGETFRVEAPTQLME